VAFSQFRDGGVVTIAGAHQSNGVTHAVDKVLLPM